MGFTELKTHSRSPVQKHFNAALLLNCFLQKFICFSSLECCGGMAHHDCYRHQSLSTKDWNQAA